MMFYLDFPARRPIGSLIGGQSELYRRLGYELDKLKMGLPCE